MIVSVSQDCSRGGSKHERLFSLSFKWYDDGKWIEKGLGPLQRWQVRALAAAISAMSYDEENYQ